MAVKSKRQLKVQAAAPPKAATRTFVYAQDCSPPKGLADYVAEQMRLYALYYNKLVETERWYWGERDKLRRRCSPRFGETGLRLDAVAADLTAAYDVVRKRNAQFLSLAATDADRMKIEALYKRQRATRKEQWDELKKLWKDPTYKAQERDLLRVKSTYAKLAYNAFGADAPVFRKVHVGEVLTPPECELLAHLFARMSRAREDENGVTADANPWFAALAAAYARQAAGGQPTAAGTEHVAELKARLGRYGKPDFRPRATDYGDLWWGTRLKIAESVETAVKKLDKAGDVIGFKTADRGSTGLTGGLIACQIQGGITEADLFAGGDNRVRATVLRTRRRGIERVVRVQVRVGSIGRAPLFAEVKAVLGRPWPVGAKAMWVSLVKFSGPPVAYHADGRTKYATRDKWSLQFTLRADEAAVVKPPAEAGAAAVHLGWKLLADGELRVATWVGHGSKTPFAIDPGLAGSVRLLPTVDGKEVGEVVFPITQTNRVCDKSRVETGGTRTRLGPVDRERKQDDLQSILDLRFERIKAVVVAARDNSRLPAWFAEATDGVDRWRSLERLLAVVARWHATVPGATVGDRVRAWETETGDSRLAIELLQWAEVMVHLTQYAYGSRQYLIRWRKNLFRNVANMLRARYATVYVPDADLTQRFRKRSATATHAEAGERSYSKLASLGDLRAKICEKHAAAQRVVAERSDLSVCPKCGSGEEIGRELTHACGGCGATWDRHVTAATNLLAIGLDPEKREAIARRQQDRKKKGVASSESDNEDESNG